MMWRTFFASQYIFGLKFVEFRDFVDLKNHMKICPFDHSRVPRSGWGMCRFLPDTLVSSLWVFSFERYSLRCLFDLLNSGMLDLAKSNSLVVKTASKNRLSIWLSDFAVLVWSKFIPEVNNELHERLDFVAWCVGFGLPSSAPSLEQFRRSYFIRIQKNQNFQREKNAILTQWKDTYCPLTRL